MLKLYQLEGTWGIPNLGLSIAKPKPICEWQTLIMK